MSVAGGLRTCRTIRAMSLNERNLVPKGDEGGGDERPPRKLAPPPWAGVARGSKRGRGSDAECEAVGVELLTVIRSLLLRIFAKRGLTQVEGASTKAKGDDVTLSKLRLAPFFCALFFAHIAGGGSFACRSKTWQATRFRASSDQPKPGPQFP